MVGTSTPDESASTEPARIREYVYERRGQTHRWTHADTGLTVEVHETTGQRDPFDEVLTTYRAVARAPSSGEVFDYICGPDYPGSLPRKSEAIRAARGWMADRPDGTPVGADPRRSSADT